jgi:hypothetical protein
MSGPFSNTLHAAQRREGALVGRLAGVVHDQDVHEPYAWMLRRRFERISTRWLSAVFAPWEPKCALANILVGTTAPRNEVVMDIFEWILLVLGIGDVNGYQRRPPRTTTTSEPA